MIDKLRENPPEKLSGVTVKVIRDYQTGVQTDTLTGAMSKMELSGSNVLRYETADGSVVIVRPSGTEPKVKVYVMTSGETQAQCKEKIDKYAQWADTLA